MKRTRSEDKESSVINLEDWDKLGQNVPCLVNLRPSGKYLMEDFYYAGGLPAVIHELAFRADGTT